jgi:hypothetical protein
MFKALWLISVVLTGTTTGFYISHSVILGPWYTWFTKEKGKLPLLYETYSEFRREQAPVLYLIICYAQGLSVVAFALYAALAGRNAAQSILSAAFSMLAGILFLGTGFSKLEATVLAGTDRSPESVRRYATLNVPLHVAFAVLMLASFLGLLLILAV